MILVSPDGRYAYTQTFATGSGAAPTGTLWKIDTVAGTAQAVSSGLYPSAPVLSPDGTRLYLGQLLGEAGQDPASLTGQLAVIDTGTSNAVTPPRAVNPITLIIRTVTNAVRASVQTIAHAINQTAATIARVFGAVGDIARSVAVGSGPQVVRSVQSVFQIGGNLAASLGDTARSWARENLNFWSGVGQVVQQIPSAVQIGLEQAQREIQKRLDDLGRFAKSAGDGLARAAENTAKALQPAAKWVDGAVKIARKANPIGWVLTGIDLLFNGPKAS